MRNQAPTMGSATSFLSVPNRSSVQVSREYGYFEFRPTEEHVRDSGECRELEALGLVLDLEWHCNKLAV